MKVLRNAMLSFDELHTILTEIECTLNSRPLTYQCEDGEVLTPSHLIYGRRFSPFSESCSSDFDKAITAGKLTKRFLFLRRKLTHFWKRWRREYLVNLREQHRMNEFPSSVVAKGDIVQYYLLPVFGKVLEKLIYDSLYCHLISCKALDPNQLGFLKCDSTVNQLLSTTYTIFKAFDSSAAHRY